MKTHRLFLILSFSFVAFAAGQTPTPPADTPAPPPEPAVTSAAPPESAVTPPPPPTQPAVTPAPPPAAPAKRSEAELEKLVAPIALYPDQLVATVLPASVYPLEIVQAARFVADTNNLARIDEQPWDDNVKALAQVPEALKKLNDDLPWTIQLGEAFLAQDKEVMDAIQRLRLKTQTAGMLRTSDQMVVVVTNTVTETTVEQQVVVVTNTVVQIESANPQVIYVPQYNPVYVYSPPPTYVYSTYDPFITFAAGVAVGAIIYNNCDWHHGGCYYGGGGAYYRGGNTYNRNTNINVDRNTDRASARSTSGQGQKWQPDQSRLNRSGSAGTTSARSQEARGWGNDARPSTGNTAARPSTGAVGARPSTGAAGVRPSTGTVGARPSTGTVGARPSSPASQASRGAAIPQPSVNRPASSGSAFGGTSSGASARQYSNRGSSSRSSGSFSGGRSGGGGGRGGGGRR